MINIESKNFSFTCTPNHSWVTHKMHAPDKFELTEAWDINTSDQIIIAAQTEEPRNPSDITDDEAALLGWIITDGTFGYKNSKLERIGISQSKEYTVDVIRDLLLSSGYKFYEVTSKPYSRTFPSGKTYACKAQHWFYLTAESRDKFVSRVGVTSKEGAIPLLGKLTHSSRQAMLEAMMLADGDIKGNFCKKNNKILETFQILATLEGYALGELRRDSLDSVYIQIVRRLRKTSGNNIRITNTNNDAAWCPTTDYGTWVMRQNGRISITGNTKSVRRALLNAENQGFPIFEDAVEMLDRGNRALDTMQQKALEVPDEPENMVEVVKMAVTDLGLSMDEIKATLGVEVPFGYPDVKQAWELLRGSVKEGKIVEQVAK
jgi:hypothetical protein